MKKLMQIQSELKAPKNQRNNFGNYNYRSAEDILEAVKPLLASNDCTLTLSDEVVEIGGRIYVKATATFNDGQTDKVVTAYAREADSKKDMDESQITGTASSYARKYALNGLFLIDDTKDADTDEYQKQVSKKPAQPEQAKNGIDFDKIREEVKGLDTPELVKKFSAVKGYGKYTDKQKEAICKIIQNEMDSRKEA
jgi:ERF superfamily.